MLRYIPLLFALALASPAAHAQAVFRSVMPDGKIVYGDKPAPGAKESKQVNLPPPNIAAPTQPSAVPADPNAPAGNNNNEITTARQNLEAATGNLTAEQVARLDAASQVARPYPYWHQAQFVERNPLPIPEAGKIA